MEPNKQSTIVVYDASFPLDNRKSGRGRVKQKKNHTENYTIAFNYVKIEKCNYAPCKRQRNICKYFHLQMQHQKYSYFYPIKYIKYLVEWEFQSTSKCISKQHVEIIHFVYGKRSLKVCWVFLQLKFKIPKTKLAGMLRNHILNASLFIFKITQLTKIHHITVYT